MKEGSKEGKKEVRKGAHQSVDKRPTHRDFTSQQRRSNARVRTASFTLSLRRGWHGEDGGENTCGRKINKAASDSCLILPLCVHESPPRSCRRPLHQAGPRRSQAHVFYFVVASVASPSFCSLTQESLFPSSRVTPCITSFLSFFLPPSHSLCGRPLIYFMEPLLDSGFLSLLLVQRGHGDYRLKK